ncbi:MAG: hypothetical protein JRF49_05995 [Deltaproteobacteria bacterium]|nr:hypothetical protein [Deltaproteobacteria bacterium]
MDEKDLSENAVISSTDELNTEYDVVNELKGSLNDIYKALQESKLDGLLDKVSYSRFLTNQIDDVLSGKREHLRRRKFMVKKSK